VPAIGEFLCPECGGTANICYTTVKPGSVNILPGPAALAGADSSQRRRPGHTNVMVELVCMGPADPDTPDDDPRWEHAGQTVADILATGYTPIGLN